jgi:CotH protein
MKTFKSTLVVITAAFALVASLSAATSAVGLASAAPGGTIAGSLNAWDEAGGVAITPQPTSYDTGTVARLQANFASGTAGSTITLYKEGPVDTWTAVESHAANSNGNAYYDYPVTSGPQRLYAETAGGLETEIDTITGNDPVPQTGVLNAPTNNGKNWTADFTPGIAGKATQLQMQRIYTKETDEVNEASGTPGEGPWITLKTANQDAAGHVVFPTLSSPYPYRVEHKFRAVVGANKSNTVKFGLGQVTPKSTGLAAVYFNTNEGHAVDSRDHYNEGEFAMTAGAEGCTDIGYTDPSTRVKKSVMKGRGNYSWSFKRKSFSLKLGDKKDLCGMGAAKKYALVSQDYDKSFLRNALAGYIGKKFTNMAWTPDSRPVDLYVNGSYRGNYLLIERIAIATDRVNINELTGDEPTEQVEPGITGGYVLEWDFRKGADYNAYLGSDSGYVGVKEPENDYDRTGAKTSKSISTAQKNYISGYLNSADSALRASSCQSTSWTNYIDEASAIDYYIAMEYMKPVDGNMWASVYMYKAQNGKLFFGPMWDFDLAAGSANRAGNVVSSSSFYLRNNLGVSAQQSSNTWFNCLNKRSTFRAAVKARWNAVKGSIDTTTFLNQEKSVIATSAATSYSVAPSGASHSYRISDYQVIKSSWSSDVSYLTSWASSRKSWLSSNF